MFRQLPSLVMNHPRWPELRALRPGVIPLGPLAPGEIFTAALHTLRKHAGVLLGLSLVLVTAGQLASAAVASQMPAELLILPANPSPETLNESLLGLMPYTAAMAAIVGVTLLLAGGVAAVVVGKAVLGTRLTFAEAARELARRAVPLLGLSLVIGVVSTLGMLLFVAPGVWVWVLMALAVPALMLEQATIGQALTRSRSLVRGNWWRTFGMLGLVVLGAYGLQAAVDWLITQVAGPPQALLSPHLIGQILATAVAAAFLGVVTALIYLDRRFATDDLALELARAAGLNPPEG
jgi:hypothetical protein